MIFSRVIKDQNQQVVAGCKKIVIAI